MTIQLYHFTSLAHLPDIIRTGRLLLCESNISKKRKHAGPPVCWLSKSEDPTRCGLQHDPALQKLHDYDKIDKTRIRFTVELPNVLATRYVDWARAQGIDRKWLAEIMQSGGSRQWYVATRPIEMTFWREVRDLHADRTIWLAPPGPEIRGVRDLKGATQ